MYMYRCVYMNMYIHRRSPHIIHKHLHNTLADPENVILTVHNTCQWAEYVKGE